MSTTSPFCPACGSVLTLGKVGDFNPWVCPAGHGVAATLSECYEPFQEDELHEIWRRARTGTPGGQACPMCESAMVTVAVGWDADEVPEGTEGDGADEGHLTLDVCVRCEILWFDADEQDSLPGDLPDAEPTPEEVMELARIKAAFGASYEQAMDDRIDDRFTDRAAGVIMRTPGLRRLVPGMLRK